MCEPSGSGRSRPSAPEAPISVKRLLEQLKARVEPAFAALCVIGEVSNFRGSGRHWYFTLKDEGAQIQCAVWASQQRFLAHVPKDGQRVILKGSLNVYVQGGSLTLTVTHCEPAGVGDLQARLRLLEAELRAQGLFDRAKRPLPIVPRRIGVVAALGGAALRDVLEITRSRAPGISITVVPAAAQGERCVPEVLAALQALQDPRWGCDVILLVRGGGSLEDLWAYNDPTLVQAVAASTVPVITGVGHEIDVTLVDLAADCRAATPSQAAERATPDQQRLRAELGIKSAALWDRMRWRLRGLESTVNLLADSRGMREVPLRLERLQVRLDALDQRLRRFQPTFAPQRRLDHLAARLTLAHPERRIDTALNRLALLRQRLLALAPAVGREADQPWIQDLWRRLESAMAQHLTRSQRDLDVLQARQEGLDPRAPLQRGFVLARDEAGQPVTSARTLPAGAGIRLQWLDGERLAELRELRPGQDE